MQVADPAAMSALTKVVSLSQILFGTDYAGLGAEAGQQGQRVFAVDLLQLLSAKGATFLQSLDVIRKGARGVGICSLLRKPCDVLGEIKIRGVSRRP